jgi:ABC-2 type transport system ATP-binding protein
VARGGTIFLTSHILEIVERLSTHIGVIAQGKIVAQGRIEELRAGAGVGKSLEELFIGLVGGEPKLHAGLDWI